MDSILQRYKKVFTTSSYTFKWLSLEVIAVITIIAILSGYITNQLPTIFYKTYYSRIFSNEVIDFRISQQEHLAWHGEFYNTPLHSYPYEDDAVGSTPQVKSIEFNNGQLSIRSYPFENITEQQLTLDFTLKHQASIFISCSEQNNSMSLDLTPFICKLKHNENQ